MRKAVLLATCGFALLAQPALAQDVVMRRPLPHKGGINGTQTEVTPTPTPTPAGTPTPTTVIPDTFDNTPTPTPTGDPDGGSYVYTWEVGEWQGTASCGTPSTLTRTVRCKATPTGDGGGIGPIFGPVGAIDGTPGVLPAGWLPSDGASMAPAVYDPSQGPRFVRVQSFPGFPDFPDFPGLRPTIYVANSYCAAADGPMPATSYSGAGAACEYTAITSTQTSVDNGTAENPGNIDTSWHLPDGAPGTATCSSAAYRNLPFVCKNQNNVTVDNRFCTDNIRTGGTRNTQLPEQQTGNYSNCSAHWETRRNDLGCHEENAPYGDAGPVHYADLKTVCVSSSGQVLEGPGEAACFNDPDRPFDGVQAIGTCRPSVTAGSSHQRCMVDGGGMIDRKTLMLGRDLGVSNEEETSFYMSCKDRGATCIGSRSSADGNYDLNPNDYSHLEMICTGGQPLPQPPGGYYIDSCANAKEGADACPSFYSNGLYSLGWTPVN